MRKSTRLVAVIAFVVALMLPASSAEASGCTGCGNVLTPNSSSWACQDMNPGSRICISCQSSCWEDCSCPAPPAGSRHRRACS